MRQRGGLSHWSCCGVVLLLLKRCLRKLLLKLLLKLRIVGAWESVAFLIAHDAQGPVEGG
jgi:hypothetical protein